MNMILSEGDYKKIIEGAFTYTSSAGLVEYFEKKHDQHVELNSKIWFYLMEALNRTEYLCIEEVLDIQDRVQSEDEWNISQLSTYHKKYLFIYNYLNHKIDRQVEKMQARAREFKLKYLPKVVEDIEKYNSQSEKRRLFSKDKIRTYCNWIEELVYGGLFEYNDLTATKDTNALKLLVGLYFSIQSNYTSVSKEELSIKIAPDSFITYITLDAINPKNARIIFKRSYINYCILNSDKKVSFNIFLQYEKKRFNYVLGQFEETHVEYERVNKYLYYVKNKLTTKDVGSNSRFNIDKKHHDALTLLAQEIEEIIPFLNPKTLPLYFADTLTSDEADDVKPIYFDIETTTLAFILNWISNTYSTNNKFTAHRIGKSKLFYIPSEAKPSTHKRNELSVDNLLTRQNVATSLERFTVYKEDIKLEEYHHYKQILPILKKFTSNNSVTLFL